MTKGVPRAAEPDCSCGEAEATANPDTVDDCSLRYDHPQAAALPLKDSAELIRGVREERYGDQPA
ncbi:hypothetical protein GCM10010415_57110 [Streptomyces atrovirens]